MVVEWWWGHEIGGRGISGTKDQQEEHTSYNSKSL